MALGLGRFTTSKKSHIITLSFDDGFKKSFHHAAEIHEEYGYRACLNVIASGHLPEFQQVDQWIQPELMGSFDDWNNLKSRGHEVMPHSWKHLNLARRDIEESKDLITKCLEYFEDHLDGYKNEEAVFNFPFNASTSELEAWTLKQVMAIRTRGETGGAIAKDDSIFRQGCNFFGPDLIDDWLEKSIADFLQSEGGWLVLNMHGLDGEGWGTCSSACLDRELRKLSQIDHVDVLPLAEVIKTYGVK